MLENLSFFTFEQKSNQDSIKNEIAQFLHDEKNKIKMGTFFSSLHNSLLSVLLTLAFFQSHSFEKKKCFIVTKQQNFFEDQDRKEI